MTILFRHSIFSAISFILLLSCTKVAEEGEITTITTFDLQDKKQDPIFSNDTKGYNEMGVYKNFDCPDDLNFAPLDIRYWAATPAVNNRLPTYKETTSGVAIHHYQGYPNVRPFFMKLPKLAYTYSHAKRKKELVVVIQIAQTAEDTVVGYRYLSGGCGGSLYRDFHFLTDEEVQKEVH